MELEGALPQDSLTFDLLIDEWLLEKLLALGQEEDEILLG